MLVYYFVWSLCLGLCFVLGLLVGVLYRVVLYHLGDLSLSCVSSVPLGLQGKTEQDALGLVLSLSCLILSPSGLRVLSYSYRRGQSPSDLTNPNANLPCRTLNYLNDLSLPVSFAVCLVLSCLL
jgi:hypothetical protein